MADFYLRVLFPSLVRLTPSYKGGWEAVRCMAVGCGHPGIRVDGTTYTQLQLLLLYIASFSGGVSVGNKPAEHQQPRERSRRLSASPPSITWIFTISF